MSNPATECYTCNNGNPLTDLTGIQQLHKINKIISDDYTTVFISILLIIGFLIVIYYFGKQLILTLSSYYKQASSVSAKVDPKQDSELYDDTGLVIDPDQYFEPGKLDFVENMQKVYKEYNKEKAEYIKNVYKRQDDDVIDTSTLYQQYDDYNYKKDSN